MALTLAHEQWGDGPRPLLLLHGFTGNRASFHHLRSLLGASVRAIAVDLPGHGESPLPARQGRDGFLETVDALVRLVDRLKLGTVDLLGYSQGARLALALALRAPDRFGRLIMESGSPGLHRRKARRARRVSDGVLASLIRRRGVDAFVERWESLALFDGLRRLPLELQAALRARRRACTVEGLTGALACLGLGVQPDYWPVLHRQRLPTLLLTGALDMKFTRLARRMAAELPVAWWHTFPGCGHAPHLEVPREYAVEVLSFLRTPWYEAPAFDSPPVKAAS